MLRERGLRTAVSGACFLSCSRMFLGGSTRAFTDDYAPEVTLVGFHGHYDKVGRLVPEAVRSFGLKAWIIRYSDGKADEALVERWINIPVSYGGAMFYPVEVAKHRGAAAYFCNGTEQSPTFGCERLGTDALKLGVLTTLVMVHSNDQTELRRRLVPPSPTNFSTIDDVESVPLRSEMGRQEYRRFLDVPPPRHSPLPTTALRGRGTRRKRRLWRTRSAAARPEPRARAGSTRSTLQLFGPAQSRGTNSLPQVADEYD